jgi:hypothetical protein
MKFTEIIKYNELFLYSIGYTILLGIFNDFKSFIKFMIPDHRSSDVPMQAIGVVLTFLVIALLIYHAYSDRRKYLFEKEIMLLVVFIHLVLSVAVSIAIVLNEKYLLILFPLFNIIHGSALLVLIRIGKINSENISDHNTDPWLVLGSTVVISMTFFISQNSYQQHFYITYCMCLTINYLFLSLMTPLLMYTYMKIKKLVS